MHRLTTCAIPNISNPMSDTLETARRVMLRNQLQRRGITSPRVLAAMDHVPRERFVPEESREDSYADRALAIDFGQTISQPFIVGLMTQALDLTGTELVLEVGTGSGYQTAILAELAGRVVSIERHAELSQHAAEILGELGYQNVLLQVGDGSKGCAELAPFDRIICTAAATQLPMPLFDQLVEGGVLVIPLGDADSQALQVIRKVNGRPLAVELSGCRFVPLIGAEGRPV
jgi:protein-L-isoaspartate(D-aspartate) O-methyltransferase